MKSEYCSFKSLVSPFEQKKPINWDRQFGRRAPVDVEIGFGMGEVLMRTARQSPDRNFIGIEQHWERICKTLRAMTREQSADPAVFGNIRIVRVDARVVFERLFASRSVDTIYCLFPCPWPKKGHVKHRLFAHDFLRLLNNRLKKNGSLRIVTDFYSYFEWMLEQAKNTGFQVKAKTVEPQYDTKFERKWQGEGQEEFFEIDLLKKKHIKAAVKKTYGKKGKRIVELNFKAIDDTLACLHQINIPDRASSQSRLASPVPDSAPEFVRQVTGEIIAGRGDAIPVSRFPGDGTYPLGTAAYEKRNLALEIPVWDADLCTQCGKCPLVCPHAAIRCKIVPDTVLQNAPASFKYRAMLGKDFPQNLHIIYQVAPEDCTGCGLCVDICPIRDKRNVSHKALNMAAQPPLREQERSEERRVGKECRSRWSPYH